MAEYKTKKAKQLANLKDAINYVGFAIYQLEQMKTPCGIIQDALTDLQQIFDALDDCKDDYK